jgi:hypothetical protein
MTVVPLASTRRAHEVLGRADARELEHDREPVQQLGSCVHVTVRDLDIGAHRFEPAQMHVDLAAADVVAARAARRAPHRSARASGRAR